MKDSIKAQRLAALLGLEVPREPTKEERRTANFNSREAEAAILYREHPDGFKRVLCRVCHKSFAVNRTAISCCSDECRKAHLQDTFGLIWDPTGRTPEDRWRPDTGGVEPLLVPPVVLEILDSLALPDEEQQVG